MWTLPRKRRTRRPPRKGFVLLMALMLIALAALVLTGLARYSLTLAAESERQREDMQLRWGAISVSRALLHRTDQLFLHNEQLATEQGEKIAELFPLEETVRLGGVDFRVILDDENRKLNVNRVIRAAAQRSHARHSHARRGRRTP